jgi:quinol monooxygenase YgiN
VAEDDPAAFLFYERWDDDAALQEHLSSPHIGAVFALVGELCDGPPSIVRYTQLR